MRHEKYSKNKIFIKLSINQKHQELLGKTIYKTLHERSTAKHFK